MRGIDLEVAKLVSVSLKFHQLNKAAERRFGLSLVQYHLLVSLRDRPGCSPLLLAASMGMHPSSLTPALRRLQRKKAIFIAPDPRDSRRKILALTRIGQDLSERFFLSADQVFPELRGADFSDRIDL